MREKTIACVCVGGKGEDLPVCVGDEGAEGDERRLQR